MSGKARSAHRLQAIYHAFIRYAVDLIPAVLLSLCKCQILFCISPQVAVGCFVYVQWNAKLVKDAAHAII